MTDDKSVNRLRPRARLMMMLGLELISSDAVALAELVKNSYDADASTVLIRLRDRDGSRPASLVVLDNGSGMPRTIVETVWLEPATPSRKRRKNSPGGRRSLGEKGIGRFAVAKLANRLELVTSTDEEETSASIDWDQFADDSKFLDEIEIDVRSGPRERFRPGGPIAGLWRRAIAGHAASQKDLERHPPLRTGTYLEMEPVRSNWDSDLVEEIQRLLSRLISPRADAELAAGERDFRILLDLPPRLGAYAGWVGPPEELSRPHYSLNASVAKNGDTVVEMRMRNEGGSRPPLRMTLSGVGGRSPACGPFELSLNVWDRDRSALMALSGESSFQEVRQILDQAAGVSVYRDGFRVLPYGEPGDDWLELDRRRINDPTKRISNNQIVGTVTISRDQNPDLVDQTNREGLVDGPALEDLKLIIKEIVTPFEQERYDLRPRQPKSARSVTNVFEPVSLADVSAAAAQTGNVELMAVIEDAEERLREHSTQVREVVSRYQRLATLGQLVDRMIHEVAQPIVVIRQAAATGLEIVEDYRKGRQTCTDAIDDLHEELQAAHRQARVVADVIRRLSPFGGRRRGRPHIVVVEDAMRDVQSLIGNEITSREIDVVVPTSRTEVTVDGTELQEILLNLLTNATYWTSRSRKRPRQIRWDIERYEDKSLGLLISDTGPGVARGDAGQIFEPYFTKREGGVGLGLSLAGQIVEDYYGGRLELIEPGQLGGATFRALLRRRVGE